VDETNLKIMKSERLQDTAEGGGRMIGQQVVDGQSNNLFDDVSELDRAYGRVSLRKVFTFVDTPDTDTLYGATLIVDDEPDDARVAVTLFPTSSWSDRRSDAVSRMESYLTSGPMIAAQLYGDHVVGQRAISYCCDASVASPEVGETLVLSIESGTGVGTVQYVRVTRILSRRKTTFWDEVKGQNYHLDNVVVEISEPLRSDFPSYGNGVIFRSGTPRPPERLPTIIRKTVAANASRFFGITKLTEAVSPGSMQCRAASLTTQVVPAAQGEIPIVDAVPWASRGVLLPIPGEWRAAATSGLALTPGQTKTVTAGRALLPGTVSVTVGSVTLIDDGKGILPASGGVSGSINYDTGDVTLTSTALTASTLTITGRPAVRALANPFTGAIAIKASNRAATWIKTLMPAPAPGSVAVDYLAGGKWVRLLDNGAGILSGPEGGGGGQINYATGTVLVTLGALPDVDSEVMFSWSSLDIASTREASLVTVKREDVAPGRVTQAFAVSETNGAVSFTLGTVPIQPGSVTIDWEVAGSKTGQVRTLSAYDDGVGGLLRATTSTDDTGTPLSPGALIGAINYSTGAVTLTTRGAGIEYVQRAGSDSSSGTTVSNTSGSSSNARSYSADPIKQWQSYRTDGIWTETTNDQRQINTQQQVSESISKNWQSNTSWQIVPEVLTLASAVTCRWRGAGAGGAEIKPVIRLPIYGAQERVLPNSVVLKIGNFWYYDRGDGALYSAVNPVSGLDTVSGSVDYTSGRVVITQEPTGGIADGASIAGGFACLRPPFRDNHIVFRIPGAPLNPGSVQIRVTRLDTSATLVLTPNGSGYVDHAVCKGRVDYQSGVAYLSFYELKALADLSPADLSAWWYSASGYVLVNQDAPDEPTNRRWPKPVEIDAGSLRVSGVAITRLPLSSEVLGIDTVRLPPDGRVPIIAAGDIVVVHHTAVLAVSNPGNGQVIDCGRQRLSRVRLFDGSGSRIATNRYTADLDTGLISLTNVAGLPTPWKIEHRIEDMALVSDVQIDGTITLTRPLSHNFPANESRISSAVIMSDLRADTSIPFAQSTWTGVWANARIGSNPNAQYNSTLYPINVSNAGAITERWLILFNDATTVRIIGEAVGQIATLSIAQAIAPINPATGAPYFSIAAAGWGSGWSAGNCLRFNTRAAGKPCWIVRTVSQGPAATGPDSFRLEFRGDIDA